VDGHRDIETTQRYADYAPSPHEKDLVEAAFTPEDRAAGGMARGRAAASVSFG
jgi:hypothetical protein